MWGPAGAKSGAASPQAAGCVQCVGARVRLPPDSLTHLLTGHFHQGGSRAQHLSRLSHGRTLPCRTLLFFRRNPLPLTMGLHAQVAFLSSTGIVCEARAPSQPQQRTAPSERAENEVLWPARFPLWLASHCCPLFFFPSPSVCLSDPYPPLCLFLAWEQGAPLGWVPPVWGPYACSGAPAPWGCSLSTDCQGPRKPHHG